MDLNGADQVDDKPEFLSHFPQEIDVALPVVAEGVIISHDDLPDPHFLNQNVLDEVTGRDSGKLPVKGHAHDDVDARSFNEFQFLACVGNQPGTVGGSHDFQGVGFKSHDHRLPADGFCPFLDLVKKGEVSYVHAVEIADGQHRIAERFFDLVEVEDDLHELETE